MIWREAFAVHFVMEKLSRLTPEDRDNFTAYLDGELDENGTRRIESLLTSSAVARNDVEILARTYELLDVLPRPRAPGEFTEKTVATAKLEGYRKPLHQQPWFRPAQQAMVLAGWGFVLLIAGMCGFALAYRWVPQSDDQLLDALPLIQNLDMYNEANSVKFLHELSGQPQMLEELRRQGGLAP